MRELAEDAVLDDRVGEDFGDGPVSRRRGDEEDEGADFARGEDALGLASVAAFVSKERFKNALFTI